jgi:thymidylate synthase (FAD)
MSIVELEFITPNAEEFIGRMAGICTNRGTTDRDQNIKRAVHCVNKGHLSTLRFAHAVFNISDITRSCSHQLVRHKFLDFLQESQRYVEVSEYLSDYYPPSVNCLRKMDAFDAALRKSYGAYKGLIGLGVLKEDARYVLPEYTKTKMNVVGSFQAWLDFINLRSTKETQYEIRNVAVKIKELLSAHAPNVFKGVGND